MNDRYLEPTNSERIAILAEDQPDMSRLLQFLLKRDKNLKVLTASNGREALDLIRLTKGKIEFLLTDMSMPEMNGEELVTNARNGDSSGHHLPVEIPIIIASSEECEKVRRMIDTGQANRFVLKGRNLSSRLPEAIKQAKIDAHLRRGQLRNYL